MRFRKKSKVEDLSGVAKIGAYVRRAAQEPKVRRVVDALSEASATLTERSTELTERSTERSRGRIAAFAGAALGVLVAAAAFIWKDKLRSLFSSETCGTEDEVGSQGSAETALGSVETTVPTPPQVAPASSGAFVVQAPPSTTDADDAGIDTDLRSSKGPTGP